MTFFSFGHKIGEGAFSKVYEGMERSTKQLFAIKVISKKKYQKKAFGKRNRNYDKIKSYKHPSLQGSL